MIFEALVKDKDGMGFAAPLTQQLGARFQRALQLGAATVGREQLVQRVELTGGRFAETAIDPLLQFPRNCEDEEVFVSVRRGPV